MPQTRIQNQKSIKVLPEDQAATVAGLMDGIIRVHNFFSHCTAAGEFPGASLLWSPRHDFDVGRRH